MKILLIYTGGTIGMVPNIETKALEPAGVQPIKAFLKAEKLAANTKVISLSKSIDSSDFGLQYFKELATCMEKNYHYFDGFLILMGTDTMAYVSSLLSFCIEGLSKPIVFTGGQFPLFKKNSDSKTNLTDAITGLYHKKFPLEVGIYFNKQWNRAVCTTKIDSKNVNAFYSKNSSKNNYKRTTNIVTIKKNLSAKIGVVKLTPFKNEELLTLILNANTLDGLVLEVFGAGNLPSFSNELQQIFKKKIKQGLRVVVLSQCMYGGVSIGIYKASNLVEELGFVSATTMTLEASVAKMLYLHDKKLNMQEYNKIFKESMRGEC